MVYNMNRPVIYAHSVTVSYCYCTHLCPLLVTHSDVKKARLLLKSVITTNPKHSLGEFVSVREMMDF